MPHQAEIIAVGTELLLGNIANPNAQFLSQLLASAGVNVLYHTAVGDNPQRLRAAVETARSRCDLLVFTGGLGPTYDDMTKETVAGVFGLTLEYHPEVMEEIQQYFDRVFHRPMPACNRQQAMLPQGCTVLHNPGGTAPGCIFTAGGVTATNFGTIGPESELESSSVSNCTITGTSESIGAIAAYNGTDATIRNVKLAANANVQFSTPAVTIGGLAGMNEGTVTGCQVETGAL